MLKLLQTKSKLQEKHNARNCEKRTHGQLAAEYEQRETVAERRSQKHSLLVSTVAPVVETKWGL
jgi:hypothetical protein